MRIIDASRAFAGLVAVSAFVGLTVQFRASFAATPSALETAWILVRYFTIVANLLVVPIFVLVSLHPTRFVSSSLRGGMMLTMMLVAIVYQVLLAGTMVQTGPEKLADLFLHRITPVLVLVDWVIYAPKGGLRWRDPLLWAILPILYLPYGLARGAADGIYPYPFLDLGRFGASQVATNAVVIAIGFLACGFALVWFDRRIGGRRRI